MPETGETGKTAGRPAAFFGRVASALRWTYRLYADGFRGMTLGRTLWTVIIIKLIVIFAVLKVFFFPDFLKTKAGAGGEAGFVAGEMERRAPAVTTAGGGAADTAATTIANPK